MWPRLRRRLSQPVMRLLRKRRRGTSTSESRCRSEKWAIFIGGPTLGRNDASANVGRATEADPRRARQRGRVARGGAQPHGAILERAATHDVEATAGGLGGGVGDRRVVVGEGTARARIGLEQV